VRSESYVLDRIHGVVMNVPLVFRRAEEAPFVLPKPISWGGRMDFQRFMDFVKRPTDPASLTLRLRPSVHPGLIRPPPPSGIAIPPPPVRGPNQRLAQPIMARTWNRGPCLFGHQPALDPGPVTLPSGDVLTPEQLAAFLPRLRRITLQVTVMQHGWFASWKLTHFAFLNPMVVSDETEIPIR
jgi:hypothetical protein